MNLDLLRAERMRRGVTQEKIAKGIGFKDKSSYCLIEKGKTSVSVDIANKISSYLGLSKDMTYKIFFEPKVQETSTNVSIQDGGEYQNAKHNSENQRQRIL